MGSVATEQMLGGAYAAYCSDISPRSMAADIRPLTFLYELCRQRRAAVVSDFGSGFSSYVLAHYAATAPYPVTVVSVDDNPEWLAKTAGFLHQFKLPTAGLMLWAEWLAAPIKFDVGFYDLASGDVREAGMAPVMAAGDAVLFDDAQHPGHAACMVKTAVELGCKTVDVAAATLDETGRFGLLVDR